MATTTTWLETLSKSQSTSKQTKSSTFWLLSLHAFWCPWQAFCQTFQPALLQVALFDREHWRLLRHVQQIHPQRELRLRSAAALLFSQKVHVLNLKEMCLQIYTPEPSVVCEIIEAIDLNDAIHYVPQLWTGNCRQLCLCFAHFQQPCTCCRASILHNSRLIEATNLQLSTPFLLPLLVFFVLPPLVFT